MMFHVIFVNPLFCVFLGGKSKTMKNRITSLLLLSLSIGSITAQEKKNHEESKMQWFRDAKLGVFIHWGIYSVNGISESWSFLTIISIMTIT